MNLLARTRRVDDDLDLAGFAGSEGFLWAKGNVGLAGRGEAVRVPADEPERAQKVLAAIASEDEVARPGCGPVAFGALPFWSGAALRTGNAPSLPESELVVPALIAGRDGDGTRWLTTVGPPDKGPAQPDWRADARAAGSNPSSFRVDAPLATADWCRAVAAGRDAVRAGRLAKLVLAREVVITADQPVPIADLLDRLGRSFPDAYRFSVGGLVGASPELLVARAGDVVRAHPMAGTVPRSGDPTADARSAAGLLASAKDRSEHQITIDMVHDTLLPWCSYLDYEAEPSVVAMANVAHLATMVEGRLSSPTPSVLELVDALHPTPAVGGSPRAEALALIAELEQLDRRRYAGPVGWVDGRGNGSWAVGIRCAEVDGPTARLFAGVGVVADSDPAAELAETQAKLQALLSALIRP